MWLPCTMGELVQWSGASWAGWHCVFNHKILILQETWCNPEENMGGSVWLFLPCSVILAWVEQEHGWVLGFPHSFLLLELRGYSNSPASWSRVIGLFSQSPPATPVQDLQDWFDSTSLMITPLVFWFYCFPVLASVTSGCFSIFWWSLAQIGYLCPWAHQSHPPPGMEPWLAKAPVIAVL